jgi:hypothetical protein
MTVDDNTLSAVIDKLRRYAHVRDRSYEREPRIISVTDDEAVTLLEALESRDWWMTARSEEISKDLASARQQKDDVVRMLNAAEAELAACGQLLHNANMEALRVGAENEPLEVLGARAAKLVAMMLQQAGRYLTGGFGEINEVLVEARKRGWLEPIPEDKG